MTEVNEGVALLSIEDPNHDPKTCCFCHKGEPKKLKNDFAAKPDGDDRAHLDPIDWVKFHNDAHTLGANIGQEMLSPDGYWILRNANETYKASASTTPGALAVGVAAHHLIPGNAALAKSILYKTGKLGKTGEETTNIGYDINKAANGIWAPGNYAIRPWVTRKENFKEEYAEAAILTVEVQFHDAHPVYSVEVLRALDEISKKTDNNEQICPYAADEDPATRKLITLVARLDFLSERCRRMVSFPSSRWKSGMFLSRFSHQFITKRKIGG